MDSTWRMIQAETLLARMLFALDMVSENLMSRDAGEEIVREAVDDARALLALPVTLPHAYLN